MIDHGKSRSMMVGDGRGELSTPKAITTRGIFTIPIIQI